MNIIVNILYTSTNGQAGEFAEEMVGRNIVKVIRAEEGNEEYDYYFPLEDPESLLLIDCWKDEEAIEKHHESEMMTQINELRKKYKLKMKAERFTDLPQKDTHGMIVIYHPCVSSLLPYFLSGPI